MVLMRPGVRPAFADLLAEHVLWQARAGLGRQGGNAPTGLPGAS